MLKRISVIAILIFAFVFTTEQSSAKSNTDFIQIGEKLIYEVSFFGIKLGTVKLVVLGYDTVNGHKTLVTKAYMNSYNGIPFVDLNVVFKSWMSPYMSYSYKFEANTKEKKCWRYERIMFDYDHKKITLKGYRKKKQIKNVTIHTSRKWSDGLSLFYVARKLLNIKKNVSIPTIMDKDTVFTTINFSGKKEKVDIDAVSYPVRTVYFNGNANWTGIYGMTGEFEGWFSDDKARIPIKAKMEVYVGSVDIELIKWKRKGWKPPK